MFLTPIMITFTMIYMSNQFPAKFDQKVKNILQITRSHINNSNNKLSTLFYKAFDFVALK